MRPTLPFLASFSAIALLACAEAPPPAPAAPPTSAPAAAPDARAEQVGAQAERPPLAFVSDDLPGAAAKARAEGKALFVDAWAPWCHTCLSMKHYVFTDPSLRPLADRVVFAEIDTDRPENAAFLEKHELTAWPTFFLLEPATGDVMGLWPGAASVQEIRELVDESLRAMDARTGAARPADHPDRLLVEAKRAKAAGDPAAAAATYERALAKGSAGWARRSDALIGLVEALYRKKDYAACADKGKAHIGEVKGAAVPADFASLLLECAEHLPEDAQKAPRDAAIARLRAITREPPADASADDRADAWGILAEGLKAQRDEAGARAANESKLAILEKAAGAAPTQAAASAYDYGRAMAYLALARGDEAIAMLTQREAQLPEAYEPPARLAQVLHAMGRDKEALPAVDRAIARAYGPRRLRYLKLRGEIQKQLGDKAAQVAALREEVAGYEALAKGHANPGGLEDARRRLAEAEKAAPSSAPGAKKPAPSSGPSAKKPAPSPEASAKKPASR